MSRCLAEDFSALHTALPRLTAILEHDDRGSRVMVKVPAEDCTLCGGSGQIEDHAHRTVERCALTARLARLGSLLASLSADDPDLILQPAAAHAVSPALLGRLGVSVAQRKGACLPPGVTTLALAVRSAWVFGARTAVCSTNDLVSAARPPGDPELVFLQHENESWKQDQIEALELWISWCQRTRAGLWLAVAAKQAGSFSVRSGQADVEPAAAGWGKVSRQISARVARAKGRHWSENISSAARSRLLEVCDIHSIF